MIGARLRCGKDPGQNIPPQIPKEIEEIDNEARWDDQLAVAANTPDRCNAARSTIDRSPPRPPVLAVYSLSRKLRTSAVALELPQGVERHRHIAHAI
jgi:hypothetical protein